MLEIEWKSSLYHSNGRLRSRPKASTVHGWLVKWRATFSGNERLRKEGMREMREAKAVRERKRQRRAAKRAKAGTSKSSFRLWPVSFRKKKRQSALTRPPRRPSSKRPSHESTQHPTSPNHSPRPTPSSSRQPSQVRKGSVERNARSSRKASHDSRRDIVRTVEKKRQPTTP